MSPNSKAYAGPIILTRTVPDLAGNVFWILSNPATGQQTVDFALVPHPDLFKRKLRRMFPAPLVIEFLSKPDYIALKNKERK